MKKMDYCVSGPANRPVFEPISDAAKARTSGDVAFENRQTALEFMLGLQIEGFRFSGAHLIDPEQKLVRTGHFLRQPDGLIQTGRDWGPRVPVYEVGDVVPLRDKNGVQVGEAEIEEILDDDQVQKNLDCVIALICKERDGS